MADSKHDPLGKKNVFCQVRGTPCDCGNNYQTICKPRPMGDYAITFAVGGTGKTQSWEAHHILSISCVAILPKTAKKKAALKRVLKVTKWCINNRGNMIAMPKFGQTVMYYTNVKGDFYYIVNFKAPSFKDVPQHDFEHDTPGGYCTEVKKDVLNLWNEVAEAVQNHEEVKKGVESQLNNLSRTWRRKLKERGERQGGTHAAWKQGMKDPQSKWYLPFSMASAAHAEERYFTWTDKVNTKMDKIRNSLRAIGVL